MFNTQQDPSQNSCPIEPFYLQQKQLNCQATHLHGYVMKTSSYKKSAGCNQLNRIKHNKPKQYKASLQAKELDPSIQAYILENLNIGMRITICFHHSTCHQNQTSPPTFILLILQSLHHILSLSLF